MKPLLFILLVLFSSLCTAQFDHINVLQGQTGNTLIDNLVLNYKPFSLNTYSVAKDNMLSQVYKENDSIQCVYTGLKRHLPASGDPSVIMYDNGSSISIDTEHSYPQSKVINEAGKSDLHHMYPTRAVANNGRGSVPFGTLSSGIDKWYYLDQTYTSTPNNNIEPLSSKLQNNSRFEPRDDHKGNIARAMFYFYTMYKSEADAVDPNYFDSQKSILCQWHLDDPVDSLEWLRNNRISWLQGFKVNPFIHDCTLAYRCNYCSNNCSAPVYSKKTEKWINEIKTYPVPTDRAVNIELHLNKNQEVHIYLMDVHGKIIFSEVKEMASGLIHHSIDVSEMEQGIYTLFLQSINNSDYHSEIIHVQ